MATLSTIGQAEGYAAALQALTGIAPAVDYQDTYTRIYYDPAGQVAARAWVESQLNGPPGPVRVDLLPVVLPSVLKRIALPLLGIVAVSYLLGKVT